MATRPSNHNLTTCNCGEIPIILTVKKEDNGNKGQSSTLNIAEKIFIFVCF